MGFINYNLKAYFNANHLLFRICSYIFYNSFKWLSSSFCL